jgi:hypothetical protein
VPPEGLNHPSSTGILPNRDTTQTPNLLGLLLQLAEKPKMETSKGKALERERGCKVEEVVGIQDTRRKGALHRAA